MSAPTTPRTWALVVPPSPGPETTAVHLVGTDEVWVRTGHPESSREWMLTGATCRCGKLVTLSGGAGCRWQLVGQRWEPSCDVAPIRVEGARGDHAAMRRALDERRRSS